MNSFDQQSYDSLGHMLHGVFLVISNSPEADHHIITNKYIAMETKVSSMFHVSSVKEPFIIEQHNSNTLEEAHDYYFSILTFTVSDMHSLLGFGFQ